MNPKREAIYSFTLRRSSDFAEGIVQSTLLAGFVSPVNENDSSGVQVNSEPAEANATLPPHDHNEKVWRLRHLKRSVLKEMVPGVDIKDIGGTSGSSLSLGSKVVTESSRRVFRILGGNVARWVTSDFWRV